MKGTVAVPYQKTFLLVGGRSETFLSHHFLNGVFWYNGERDVWQRYNSRIFSSYWLNTICQKL